MSARPRVVVATRNRGKLAELQRLLADVPVELIAVSDLGAAVPEVDEDRDTFEGNAEKKARETALATGLPALADDSGLEVDALGGAPGVWSARYAGPDEPGIDPALPQDARNNAKLLRVLADVPPERRTARFRCVIAFADPAGPLGERTLLARGVCEGRILSAPRGQGGFGYDPLCEIGELGQTFAEIPMETKIRVSHRSRAFADLLPQLRAYFAK